ncbi:hypothetical protein NMY22_g4035 [Coprinellus aureogranulatus]|nr:hypothetical protein NMY22_g4035 [Coprinellus aureogranulatus]
MERDCRCDGGLDYRIERLAVTIQRWGVVNMGFSVGNTPPYNRKPQRRPLRQASAFFPKYPHLSTPPPFRNHRIGSFFGPG